MSMLCWNKAKRRRIRLAPAFIVLFVAGFIGGDLLATSGWNWQAWLRELRGRPPSEPDFSELRDYVEFMTIQHDGLDVVTGIRFASSFDRRITRQWCYAEPTIRAPGDPVYRIDLAGHDGPGTPRPYTFTDEGLSSLGLTAAGAQSLFENHCRFRDN